MLVKIFKRPKNGGSPRASINYLLSKKQDEVAVLKGDPKLSQHLAESLNFKNKYTVGCLSFEEQETEITNQSKFEMMAKFEETFFSGLEPHQYNISWVQHTDKNGRLELNFFIPNVELTTKKRLQPYFDKRDRGMAENFKQVINYEYNLTDPNDPRKKVLGSFERKNLPTTKKELTRKINNFMDYLAENGMIQDREDVENALIKGGFEIARRTKKNISIKTDGQNLRLSGLYYEENFKLGSEYGKELERHSRIYDERREERYRIATEKLQSFTKKRAQEFSKLYTPKPTRNKKTTKENIISSDVANVVSSHICINKQLSLLAIPTPKPAPTNKSKIKRDDQRDEDAERELEIQESEIRERQSQLLATTRSSISGIDRDDEDLLNEKHKIKTINNEVKENVNTSRNRIRLVNGENPEQENSIIRRTFEYARDIIDRFKQTIERVRSRKSDIEKSSSILSESSRRIGESCGRINRRIDENEKCYEIVERFNSEITKLNAEIIKKLNQGITVEEPKSNNVYNNLPNNNKQYIDDLKNDLERERIENSKYTRRNNNNFNPKPEPKF